MSTSNLDSDEKEDYEPTNELQGLLVSYKGDQLNECVKSALKRKSRVRYKCMDTYSSYLCFGTTGGAIYLYKLTPITHIACTLVSLIPCDQGSIEVIRFLPNHQTDDLLIAIGTSRGSLVVFRLNQLSGDQSPICNEIYKAESFNNNSSIKLLEHDQDLFDTASTFNKLYICDSANRLYVLDSNTIYAAKNSLRLSVRGVFYSTCPPSLIFAVKGSKINQISAHRSQLLISTDETTRLFNEQSNQINVIGQKKRKDLDFYGACFFNPLYKPLRALQMNQSNQQVNYSSSQVSLNEAENLRIFVARPMFRLWQVDDQKSVRCTHQFDPLIKSSIFNQVVELDNEPVDDLDQDKKDSIDLIEGLVNGNKIRQIRSRSDHFQKLSPIYSATLGNMLLSYTEHEIFIIDPIGARLIAWLSQVNSIVQVCCNENELYIWSSTSQGDQNQFHLRRLVLLDPTQFVLELHRVHRYMTMILFVQQFADMFRERMALPLHGKATITTVGGLLRNVLLNAWDMYKSQNYNIVGVVEDGDHDADPESDSGFEEFKSIVNGIIEESNQLKQSLTNLTDSRFFLAMTTENIDRLCSEPYASLVSLDVSIRDLHTNHVIHFSKDALNRYSSVANLSQNLQKIRGSNNNTHKTRSNFDLTNQTTTQLKPFNNSLQKLNDKKVIVERQVRLNRRNKALHLSVKGARLDAPTVNEEDEAAKVKENLQVEVNNKNDTTLSSQAVHETSLVGCKDTIYEHLDSTIEAEKASSLTDEREEEEADEENSALEQSRCLKCKWPYSKIHLKKPSSKQRKQLQWIEDNLLGHFEEYIDEILERAFNEGHWHLFLRCLAFKNRLDDYVTCCIMLDDVRLLNVEQFVVTRHGEDEIIDLLLLHMSRKATSTSGDGDDVIGGEFCFRCQSQLNEKISTIEQNCELNDLTSVLANDKVPVEKVLNADDEFSFNLVNLLEQFMMKRNADVKKVINRLLKYPKLLNESKIPASFYLKTIKSVATVAGQTPVSRARSHHLSPRGSTFKVSHQQQYDSSITKTKTKPRSTNIVQW